MIDTRHETLKALRATPVVVRALAAGLTAEEARRRPEPAEWAVVEVVAHMTDTDEWVLGRVRRMLDEHNSHLPSFHQDAVAVERRYLDMDVADQVERYAAGRADHASLLDSLDDAGWRRTGRHEEHGRITIELYEVHVANEDVDHLAQIARNLSSTRAARPDDDCGAGCLDTLARRAPDALPDISQLYYRVVYDKDS